MSKNPIIADSCISIIKEAQQIFPVVSNYMDLKRNGASYTACCPFHKENTPSFHVNEQKNIYKCFGCGKGGDAINFVMTHENKGFIDACKTVADILNIPIEYEEKEYSEKEKKIFDESQQQEAVLNYVIPFYQKTLQELPEDDKAKKYVKKRLNDETISKFEIGYGGDDRKGITTQLINKNQFEPANKLGIINRSNDKNYDGFRDRIIIPIRDKNGRLVGMGGRIAYNALPNKDLPKYINSKECEIFKKRENLFGYNLAEKAIRGKGKVIIVEGYYDVMSCHNIGQENVVGIMGTALTIEQIKLLKRCTNEVALMFDNDPAGTDAFNKALPELLKQNFKVYIILYDKKYNDPDSLVNALQQEAFKDITSTDAIIHRAKTLWQNADGNPNDQGEAVIEIAQLLCCIKNDTAIISYINMIAKECKFPISLLKNEVKAERAKIEHENFIKGKRGKNESEDTFSSIEFKNGRIYSRGKGKAISNFTIKIYFQVQTGDDRAYRVVEIKNTQGDVSVILMNSDDGVSKGSFKKIIARHGNYIFKGTDDELADLMELLQKEEKPCVYIDKMGWNARHKIYVFCNGIAYLTENNMSFLPVDNYGIVQHEGKYLFIPANSDIFKHQDALHQNERKFIKRTQRDNFSMEQWADLFYKVYGEKGKVAITYYIATLFRDIVFKHLSRFPILNLYGPPGFGKGAIAESLLHMFGGRQAPIMLGAGSTTVGLWRRLSSLNNSLLLVDEYKNNLEKKIIESLKAVYDGSGRTTGVMSNDLQTKAAVVNCAIILAGQHMPTGEAALFPRCIMLSFNEGQFSSVARESFSILKAMEEDGGFSDITFSLLKYRPLIETNFKESYEIISKQIFKEVEADGIVEDRLIINISMLLTVFYILKDQIKFPFTYEECRSFFIENMKYQNSISKGNDDVGKFWIIVENLASQRKILYDKDFRIKDGFLYLRLSVVHPLYVKELRQLVDPNALTSVDSLRHYLSLHKQSYVKVKDGCKQRFPRELGAENSIRCDKFRYEFLNIELPLYSDNDTPFPGQLNHSGNGNNSFIHSVGNEYETEDLPF